MRGRRSIFSGSNSNLIIPQQTKFGLGYQFGSAAGGSNAYAQALDPILLAPPAGVSIAVGAYNQGTISNVTMFFGAWNDVPFQNSVNLVVQNNGGIPRFVANCTRSNSNISLTANGGAGITMAVAGQYMTLSSSYNGATLLADYTTTGLGHNTGSTSVSGALLNLGLASISEPNNNTLNTGRTVTFMAGWFRPLAAGELQTVTSYIGGLPPNFLRSP